MKLLKQAIIVGVGFSIGTGAVTLLIELLSMFIAR